MNIFYISKYVGFDSEIGLPICLLMIVLSHSQHCTLDSGSYTKDLSAVSADLSSVFIVDNSPGAYKLYPGKT